MPRKNRTPESWQKLFIEIYGQIPKERQMAQFVKSYASSVMSAVAGMDSPVEDASKALETPARRWNSGIGANPTFRESDATNADVGEDG